MLALLVGSERKNGKLKSLPFLLIWRREGDSNPRYSREYA
jgi:hypothetical protein